MRTRFLSLALISAAAAGCGGDATGSGDRRLTEADAVAVTRAILATGLGVVRDGASGAPSAARRSLADGGTGTFSFTFNGTEPCRPTGAVDVAGTLSGGWDDAAQAASLQSDVSLRHDDCAIATGDGGTVILDGAPDIDLALTATSGPAGLTALRITETGAFEWEKDGSSGHCTLDLTAELVAGTQDVRLHGTFCGIRIDVTGPVAG